MPQHSAQSNANAKNTRPDGKRYFETASTLCNIRPQCKRQKNTNRALMFLVKVAVDREKLNLEILAVNRNKLRNRWNKIVNLCRARVMAMLQVSSGERARRCSSCRRVIRFHANDRQEERSAQGCAAGTGAFAELVLLSASSLTALQGWPQSRGRHWPGSLPTSPTLRRQGS